MSEELTSEQTDELWRRLRRTEVPPIAGSFELPLDRIVLPQQWDEVHAEGFTWEGNFYGSLAIHETSGTAIVEIRGSRQLAKHMLAHGDDARFGHPVDWHIVEGRHQYDIHPEWIGIAFYLRPSTRFPLP